MARVGGPLAAWKARREPMSLWALVALVAFALTALMFIQLQGVHRRLTLIEARLARRQAVGDLGLAVGTDAPDFDLPEVTTGRPVRLADLRGKRVVVTFIAPGCRECHELVPQLHAMARSRRQVAQVAVVEGGVAEARRLVREMRLELPTVADEDGALAALYGSPGTPITHLIDEHGRIAARPVVPVTWQDLYDALDGHK